MFTVRKSTTKTYGYELYWTGEKPLSWLLNGRSCGWYKNKQSAIHRAEVLNKSQI